MGVVRLFVTFDSRGGQQHTQAQGADSTANTWCRSFTGSLQAAEIEDSLSEESYGLLGASARRLKLTRKENQP